MTSILEESSRECMGWFRLSFIKETVALCFKSTDIFYHLNHQDLAIVSLYIENNNLKTPNMSTHFRSTAYKTMHRGEKAGHADEERAGPMSLLRSSVWVVVVTFGLSQLRLASAQLPEWPQSWAMNQSTIMMVCNYTGFVRPDITAKWSIVDVSRKGEKIRSLAMTVLELETLRRYLVILVTNVHKNV
jgi:hypothetical protein